MDNIFKSFLDIILENCFKVLFFVFLLAVSLGIINYLIECNKYAKRENIITFRGINKDFVFSPINLSVAYEHLNSNYHNYIQFDFEVTRINKTIDSFSIELSKLLHFRKDSYAKNIKFEEKIFTSRKFYKLKFINDSLTSKVSIKIGGDIFGGNKYYKEFLLYFNIDAPKSELKKIKIKPILEAIKNSTLIDKSMLFKINRDNPYYRSGRIVFADKFYNLFFRFIDLPKQAEYQNHVIILSTILGVLLSILVNLLFKLGNIYFYILKRNKNQST